MKAWGICSEPKAMNKDVANTAQLKFIGVTVVELRKQLKTALSLTNDAEAPDMVITKGKCRPCS